jgi:hypothetical protein
MAECDECGDDCTKCFYCGCCAECCCCEEDDDGFDRDELGEDPEDG